MILRKRLCLSVCLTLATCQGTLWSQSSSDNLKSGFEHPPASARPRVWWHWMNGNITKEGIKLDLDWMHNVGIAGFQNFDAALATPQVVEKRLAYMTPEWKDAFKYATTLADQYGMEMAIAGSPGNSHIHQRRPVPSRMQASGKGSPSSRHLLLRLNSMAKQRSLPFGGPGVMMPNPCIPR